MTTTARDTASGNVAPDGRAHESGRRRFRGVLPDRMLQHREPRWWQEIAIIGFCYWIYSEIRNLVPQQKSIAERHGRGVQHLQDALHLNFERSLNSFVADHEPIAQVMNYYYATLHFIITIAVLIWLYVAHPRIYRGARTVIFATSLIALAGFYLYPLAPPRLLPQYGYIDTLQVFHTWGSLADPKVAEHSNQYAAMPSLHIGWSLWCGVSIFLCARRMWVRLLGAIYPVCTLLVIVGTANHFIIDAVFGLIVFLIGCGVQYLLSGRSAYRKAPHPPPAMLHAKRSKPETPQSGS
ncbi:phosphatase PAP2 family protein [Jatrophihabitans telluris]|uniref:Phosphatase PAP2 family protein n=1 Tax=Jatrophihabitans telluris TaxID=2038343 RepID=A0ABY4QVK6_9ACTN|nr:phosphatase PAP2 family protein [Jatrophihabitans telluris]UQX87287.1 phosphatase PAP2 family protein [Jatrophihabitans telluris]